MKSAQVAAISAAASPLAPLFAAPHSRWFKIGLCDWSVNKRSDPGVFDLVKRVGLDGVQIDMGDVENDMHLRRSEVQRNHLEAARQAGVEIASLAISEMNWVPMKSDPRAARWLADSIDVCTAMGLKITMPAFFCDGRLDPKRTKEIDRVVGVLKDVAPKAERQRVVIGIENTLSAPDNMRIIERVGSPAIRVYYDVGNSTCNGFDICREIRMLGKLICEMHANDGNVGPGEGRVDYKAVRKALDDIRYSGWIHIECAAIPNGVVTDYITYRKYLKGIFPRNVVDG